MATLGRNPVSGSTPVPPTSSSGEGKKGGAAVLAAKGELLGRWRGWGHQPVEVPAAGGSGREGCAKHRPYDADRTAGVTPLRPHDTASASHRIAATADSFLSPRLASGRGARGAHKSAPRQAALTDQHTRKKESCTSRPTGVAQKEGSLGFRSSGCRGSGR